MATSDFLRRWFVVILHAQILSKYMFEQGLPLRGCITNGPFILEGNVFAGMTIPDAHRFAEQLSFSGTVIVRNLFDKLRSAAEPFLGTRDPAVTILIKKNIVLCGVEIDGKTRELPTLNFLAVKGLSRQPSAWDGNWEEIVRRSFTKHNKSLGPGELLKLEKTAKYFAFLERRTPGMLASCRDTSAIS